MVGKSWHKLFRGSPLALTAGVLIGAVVATGVSWASIPDATGQIHGCYKAAGKTTHALSVIDSATTASCPKGTLPVDWNTGAVIYQDTALFNGPYTEGETVATFTVPAGLMCIQATASAYTTDTAPAPLHVAFDSTVGPGMVLGIEANSSNTHMALVPQQWDGNPCQAVPAGMLSYTGTALGFPPEVSLTAATSDSNDFGSISVQVYSQ